MTEVDPALAEVADGAHYHCAPDGPACCLNTVVSCDPTGQFRSVAVNVLRAVALDGRCCLYYCA